MPYTERHSNNNFCSLQIAVHSKIPEREHSTVLQSTSLSSADHSLLPVGFWIRLVPRIYNLNSPVVRSHLNMTEMPIKHGSYDLALDGSFLKDLAPSIKRCTYFGES